LNSYMVRPRLPLSSEKDTLDTPPASAALNTAARPRAMPSAPRCCQHLARRAAVGDHAAGRPPTSPSAAHIFQREAVSVDSKASPPSSDNRDPAHTAATDTTWGL
jgi:hypothetical protein